MRAVCTSCVWRLRDDEKNALSRKMGITRTELRVFREMYLSLREGAEKRKLFFGMTFREFCELWISQQGKCALTGRIMRVDLKGQLDPNMPSLDRIDSSRGYRMGNIQFVCYVVNMIKTDLPPEDFLEGCSAVAAHSNHTQSFSV